MSLARLSALVVLVLFAYQVSSKDGVDWRYVDPASLGVEKLHSLHISMTDGTVEYAGHIAHEWENCDNRGDKYVVCFESHRLTMRLPKEALGSASYTDAEAGISSQRHNELELMGDSVGDVYSVTIDGKRKQGFVYSQDRGVIAILLYGAGVQSTVIITGRCGYGAPSSCYRN